MAERGVFSAQERVLLADDHKGNHVLDVILLGMNSSLFLKDMNEIEDMFTPGVVSKKIQKDTSTASVTRLEEDSAYPSLL